MEGRVFYHPISDPGKPLWVVSEDIERDTFMLATEAQAHELVDLVAAG